MILWGFGTPSRCFGLRFGDSYTEQSFAAEIDRLCPREGLYDIFTGSIQLPAQAEDWDLLVLSWPLARDRMEGHRPVWVSEDTGLAYFERPDFP